MQYLDVASEEAAGGERVRPYNVRIGGRRTSIRLEPREWEVLCQICGSEGITVHQFCTRAVEQRGEHSQTARIRVALLDWCYTEYLRHSGRRAARRRTADG